MGANGRDGLYSPVRFLLIAYESTSGGQAILLEEVERTALPPRSLRELISPDFFSSGNTRELSANGPPELFQLQSYLAQPALAKLPDILQSPEVRLALARMIAAASVHQTR